MAIQEILLRLLEMLGIKQSDSAKWEKLIEKLRTQKASNVDALEGLKDEIKTLEYKAVEKKKEYDKSKGDIKRIIAGEIERIFKQTGRMSTREAAIGQSIDKLSLAIEKIQLIINSLKKGVDEDTLDEIAVEVQDIISEIQRTDKAAQGLEEITYEAPKSDQIDVESRLADLDGAKKATQELSQSAQQRLKELAGE